MEKKTNYCLHFSLVFPTNNMGPNIYQMSKKIAKKRETVHCCFAIYNLTRLDLSVTVFLCLLMSNMISIFAIVG